MIYSCKRSFWKIKDQGGAKNGKLKTRQEGGGGSGEVIARTPREILGALGGGGGRKLERQAKQEPAWEVLWAGQAGACPCVLTRVPLKAVVSECEAEGILPAVVDFGPPKAASAGLASQSPTERGSWLLLIPKGWQPSFSWPRGLEPLASAREQGEAPLTGGVG